MTLDKNQLKNGIKAAFDQAKQQDKPDDAAVKLIDLLTDAIETYVKSAEVAGVKVTVQNTTGTQAGSVKLS